MCFTSRGLICYILLALEWRINDQTQGRQGQHALFRLSFEKSVMVACKKVPLKKRKHKRRCTCIEIFKYGVEIYHACHCVLRTSYVAFNPYPANVYNMASSYQC